MKEILKPKSEEFGDFYSGYISLVNGKDALRALKTQQKTTKEFLEKITPDLWNYSYADDKWTIKEIIVHLIDTERVLSYRALRLSRMDKIAMSGFDQDLYVGNSRARLRSSDSIIKEYQIVRSATNELFEQLVLNQLTFVGMASGSPISARAIAWIIAGHENHHLMVIKKRYLSS